MSAALDFRPDPHRFPAGSSGAWPQLPVYDAADVFPAGPVPAPPDRRHHRPVSPRGNAPLAINWILALVCAALVIALLVGWGGDAAAVDPVTPAASTSELDAAIEIYVVQPGDTLWAIAARIAEPGRDLRPVVDHLSEVAGGAALDVGQRIVIDHAAIAGS